MPRLRDRRRRRVTVPVKLSEKAIENLKERSRQIRQEEERVKMELEDMIAKDLRAREEKTTKELEGEMLLALARKNDYEKALEAKKADEMFFLAKKVEALVIKAKAAKKVAFEPPPPDYKAMVLRTRNYSLLSPRARFFIDWEDPQAVYEKLSTSDEYRIHLESLAKKS